jgi:hypothetical protein
MAVQILKEGKLVAFPSFELFSKSWKNSRLCFKFYESKNCLNNPRPLKLDRNFA